MSKIVEMRHVSKLPRHCTSGVAAWLSRVDMSIGDLVAGKLDSDRLREIGGFAATRLADIVEADATAKEAGPASDGQE